MSPLLEVRDLCYYYPPLHPGAAASRLWGAGLRFDLAAGRCLAITGPGGCGKSTLLLALSGLAPRLSEGRLEGSVRIDGKDPQHLPLGALADRVGLMMQDPTGQLFNETIEGEIAWGLENLGLPPAEMRHRISSALAQTGLAELSPERHPLTLSGGQGRRVALAAALALHPRLLLLDEPAGGLNPTARTQMIEVLHGLKKQGLAILLTENDPEVISALADELLILGGEGAIRQGPPAATYAALAREPIAGVALPPSSRLLAALGREPAAPMSIEALAAQFGSLKPLPGALPDRQAGEVAIAIESLSYHYDDDPPAVEGLDLCLHRGEILALMGDNGAGKSTLASLLIGLLRPDSGRVLIEGQEIEGRPVHEIARQVGLAFQNPELQMFNATVAEEIAAGPKAQGLPPDQVADIVARALTEFELQAVADDPPAVLSFGERRIVALASIAAMRTPVLVLDEPTVGLDATRQKSVVGWLKARRDGGAAVLLITHDAELAAACADRIALMHAGRVLKVGPAHRLFSDQASLKKAGLNAPFSARLAAALGCDLQPGALSPEGFATQLQEAGA